MDMALWVSFVALGIIATFVCAEFQHRASVAQRIAGQRLVKLERLIASTVGAEPTRLDANDPLRERFVFCGQWTTRGHAPTCPWQAALSEVEQQPAPKASVEMGAE